MIEAAMYLLKVSLCIATFYFLFLVLKRTTFFVANRIYLISGLVLSFIIPAVGLTVASHDYHFPTTELLNSSTAISKVAVKNSIIPLEENSFSMETFLFVSYSVGMLIMLARVFYSIAAILRLKRYSQLAYVNSAPVLRTAVLQPFSFFKWIFFPQHESSIYVLNHEKVHVQQWHSIDLLLIELSHAILWFNPIMILYKRAIKLQHEYLADSHAVQHESEVEPYLMCLLNQIQSENSCNLVSRFYSQTIKNRIVMMTKNKTSLKFSVLYFLTLPIVCLLLFSFSKPLPIGLSDGYASAMDGQTVIVVDAGHGGPDTGGQTKEGINEKDFALSLTTTLKQLAEAKGMKVILTRTADEALPLEDRMNVVKQSAPHAFISIHASYDQQNSSKAGIDCFISESNTQFQKSKQLAQQLVNHLQSLQGIRVNGIKRSNFYVLKSSSTPAVVLELGCLSNASDYTFIRESKNQHAMAEKILAAVAEFTK